MEKITDVLRLKFPQFNTILPESSIFQALNKMCCENVDYLIILENEQFSGILSEHDIANKVLHAQKPLDQVQVREFMNRSLPVVTLEDSVEYAMQLLEHYNARYVAVYDRFSFRGILSTQDLMRHALTGRRKSLENTAEENRYG